MQDWTYKMEHKIATPLIKYILSDDYSNSNIKKVEDPSK